jgi:hypothetical protein
MLSIISLSTAQYLLYSLSASHLAPQRVAGCECFCGHRQEQGRPEEASEACCSSLRKGRRRYPRAPGAAGAQDSENGHGKLNMDAIHGG